MKKVILLVALAASLTFSANAQITMNQWGQVEMPIGLGVGRPHWLGKLDVADGARIGNITSMYHSGRNGLYGEAASYTFNTSLSGLIMEQGNSESAGLYVDGDYAVIWSPGDGGD